MKVSNSKISDLEKKFRQSEKFWKTRIIDSENKSSKIVKAKDISGESNLLFMRDSVSGMVIVKKNQRKPTLNKELHKND